MIRDIARARGGQPGSDLARDIQRDLVMVDDDEEIYALELSELDSSYFRTYAQEDPPSESTKAKIRSHRLMRQAREFLKSSVEQELESLDSKSIVQFLKRLKTTVAERIKLVAIEGC